MGKGKKIRNNNRMDHHNKKHRTSQTNGVLINEENVMSKMSPRGVIPCTGDLTKTSEPPTLVQHIQSILSSLLVLGFNLLMPGSDKCAGHGLENFGNVVTDSCYDNDGMVERNDVALKRKDTSFNIQCKSCNVVIPVTVNSTDDEVRKIHNKQSPNCRRLKDQDNKTESTGGKNVLSDKVHEEPTGKDTGVGEGVKEAKAAGAGKRVTTSVSDLETDIVCDNNSESGEDVTTDATGQSESLTNGRGETCTNNGTTLTEGERGAVGGLDPGPVANNLSQKTRGVGRSWDPRTAKYPQFIEKSQRLENLEHSWDKRGYCLGDMAAAGLIQLKLFSNDLLCFYCGVPVPGLQKHDDPWIEHAMRSPDCDYIRFRKGQDYLDVIVDIYLDGDMEAVSKAIQKVAAVTGQGLSGLGANGASGACGTSVGAVGSNRTTKSDYCETNSMSSVKSSPPREYRGGLKGGAPTAAYPSQTSISSSQNVESNTQNNSSTSSHSNTFKTPIRTIPKSTVPITSNQNTQSKPQNNSSTSSHSNTCKNPIRTIPKSTVPKPLVQKPRIPKREVQAREVRARLDTEAAQRVIQMGFSSQLVGAVIAEQLIYVGDDFKSFTEMMMAVLDADEMGDAFPAKHYALGLKLPGSDESKSLPTISKSEKEQPATPQTKSLPAITRTRSPPAEDLRSLELENERLKETQTCTVCMDSDRDVLFVPCGHLVVCHNCSPRLRCCPLCRQQIKGIVKVHLN